MDENYSSPISRHRSLISESATSIIPDGTFETPQGRVIPSSGRIARMGSSGMQTEAVLSYPLFTQEAPFQSNPIPLKQLVICGMGRIFRTSQSVGYTRQMALLFAGRQNEDQLQSNQPSDGHLGSTRCAFIVVFVFAHLNCTSLPKGP